MYKRVLVPLDGSIRAERALSIASRIARASGGSVILLRVTDLKIGYGPYFTLPGAYLERARKEELANAKKYLDRVAATDDLTGLETHTEAIAGTPAETIILYAHESQADLIVMCSRGYTGFKRWTMGSAAQYVVRCSPAPVLVLREASQRSPAIPTGTRHPLRALVAVDGSRVSESVLVPALELCAGLATPPSRAEIHLMRVVTRCELPLEDEERQLALLKRDRAIADAAAYLAAIAERLNSESAGRLEVKITWSVAEEKDVASTLIREAVLGENNVNFEEYDLIALATHGFSGLHRLMHGSVSERIMSGTKLPLLVIPPREQGEQTRRASMGKLFA